MNVTWKPTMFSFFNSTFNKKVESICKDVCWEIVGHCQQMWNIRHVTELFHALRRLLITYIAVKFMTIQPSVWFCFSCSFSYKQDNSRTQSILLVTYIFYIIWPVPVDETNFEKGAFLMFMRWAYMICFKIM